MVVPNPVCFLKNNGFHLVSYVFGAVSSHSYDATDSLHHLSLRHDHEVLDSSGPQQMPDK